MKAKRFGRYLLLDKVASGGMAEVWRGKIMGESGFQRMVAIKKILPHVSEDKDFIAMFTDEANITVQLQHSNIGQVYEFAKREDIFFIAMEYISGKDVKGIWSHMRQRKTFIPPELSCFIVQKMAEGLSYAHNKRDNFGNTLGIVHRDVSPQNVLVSWDGEVKVIDFGIAKAEDKQSSTRAGTLKGKFAYMSPEQIRGLKLDGRADTFALGVCLYELLTGERGFSAESEFSLLEKVRNVEIKPPTMVNRDIPPELERIVFKALAKDRDDRYLDASDLAEDLQRYLLSRGKPPSNNALGEFLRQNFTVDYDKERLRLESYKDIEVEPEPVAPVEAAAPTAEMPAQPGFDPVAAAMTEDRTGTFHGAGAGGSGAFASAPASNTVTNAAFPGAPVGGGASNAYVISRPMTESTGLTPAPGAGGPGFAPPMSRDRATQANGGAGANKLVLKIIIGIVLALALAGAGVAAALMLATGSGTVVVTVTGPSDGADVMLDGVKAPGKAEPSLTLGDVSAGSHTLIVSHAGFKTYTQPFVLEKGKTVSLSVTLVMVGGGLRVVSEPGGAEIFVDGAPTKQKTPASIVDLAAGKHMVEVRLEGFKPAKKTGVEVVVGKEQVVDLKLRPAIVKVRILSTPAGATVSLNGENKGKTPVVVTVDVEATPQLLLEKRGCKSYSTTVVLDGSRAEQDYVVPPLSCQ
jgi:serine/threonine protein kinase